MARKVIITLPDDEYIEADSRYVRNVATQIGLGFLSGHLDAEHHWTIEKGV
jgi:hypothetical protein